MSDSEKLSALIAKAKNIVIVQADNPDGDSLGSAIALEQILTSLGKEAELFCAVAIPSYLKYLPGWSRVDNEIKLKPDLTIIADTSAASLMDKISPPNLAKLKSGSVVIVDHHQSEGTIDFADLIIKKEAVATGEIIYDLATELNWTLNQEAKDMLAISILSDSLGLMSSSTSAHSIRVIAELVEAGVNLSQIDSLRRQTYRKSLELTRYKGQLLERIETYHSNQLALLVIPWIEIERYSPLYNPPMLVIDDMRLIDGCAIAVALKLYNDGHLTAKIRANEGYPIAGKLAEHFGGGGHPYASGFKLPKYQLEDIKKQLIEVSGQLIKENQK